MYNIIKRNNGKWALVRTGAKRAASLHDSKDEAQKALDLILKNNNLPKYNDYERHTKKMQDSIAGMLKAARIMNGHSLRSLSKELKYEYSHTHLQKVENNIACADITLVNKISTALNLPSDFFYKKTRLEYSRIKIRKNPILGDKRLDSIFEISRDYFERYLEIKDILGIRSEESLPSLNLILSNYEEAQVKIKKFALSLREEWHPSVHSIYNLQKQIEDKGVIIHVIPYEKNFSSFSGYGTLKGLYERAHALITLSRSQEITVFRSRLLKQLAHLLVIFPENLEVRLQEQLVSTFSRNFLFPPHYVKQAFGDKAIRRINHKLLESVKEQWGLPIPEIVECLREANLITEGAHKYFKVWNNSREGYGWDLPHNWSFPEESNHLRDLVLRGYFNKKLTTTKASSLLRISLVEFNKLTE